MRKVRYIALNLLLLSVLLTGFFPASIVKSATIPASILTWSIVDTPSNIDNIIVSPSEINAIAIGSDGVTFYAIDITNSRVYKSLDSGLTWQIELTTNLIADGASLPVWNIVVAPDNPNLIVAVTDGTGAPNGPKEVFISEDGGNNWKNTDLPSLGAGEYISCIDISIEYGNGNRDVAIGTRNGAGTGRVYVLKVPFFGSWVDQTNPATGDPNGTWTAGDVIELKFSPTYTGDYCIIVISATASGIFLNLGVHDVAANSTTWNGAFGYPVLILDTNYPNSSPTFNQIITADLELPADFSGAEPNSLRRYYITTDAITGSQYGVYRIDNTVVYWITPPNAGRISSISYYGTYDGGTLLAGEVNTDASYGMVDIWRTADPTPTTPSWQNSDVFKSPTGGGNSGYANALVRWGPDGDTVYCGTSSADLSVGGTSMTIAGTWPLALRTGASLDESAFSMSNDEGDTWNQLSLIDTLISFLSDIAAVEAPEDTDLYDILYLTTVNTSGAVINNFDSVWRSKSDPLGTRWERVLCTTTSNNGTIVRINPRPPEEGDGIRSKVIVFADRFTEDVRYSLDEGQHWNQLYPGINVTDLTLTKDATLYILDNIMVRKGTLSSNWTWDSTFFTRLNSGHTITTPLKNPISDFGDDEYEDWVLVGDASQGETAYADFSQSFVEFKQLPAVPVTGNIHIIADNMFDKNKTIYAASNDLAGNNGKIYRWVIDASTEWEQLEPPNSAFYGLVQRNNVLYGAWNVATPPNTPPGVDRTLFPRAQMPPPIEWDDLTEGLPRPGDGNFPVLFTREPSSLKISGNNGNNNLWAIDNHTYNWPNKIGCLWVYTDILAKVGPWTTSPFSGEFIQIDPVTGRVDEINFSWRQLSYAHVYQLQLAKDEMFSFMLIDSDNITPSDPLSPGWVLAPGFLENNHDYYWRVRARRATTGDGIRSPWSAIMFFTAKAGLSVTTTYMGPRLLQPENNCGCPCTTPMSFSWSPFMGTTKYKFELSEKIDMTNPLVSTEVLNTSYEYAGDVKCNTNYFWRVMAVEPFNSEWSATFTFKTNAEPSPAQIPPIHSKSTLPSIWLWIVIFIYVVLLIAIIIFFKLTRSPMGNGSLSQSIWRLSLPLSYITRLKRIQNTFTLIKSSIVTSIGRSRYSGMSKNSNENHTTMVNGSPSPHNSKHMRAFTKIKNAVKTKVKKNSSSVSE